MAGTSDQVFMRAFRWFQSAVAFLHGEIPAQGLADPLAQVLRTGLGLELDKTEATIDPSAFAATRAAAESLALATLVTGETVAALKTLGEVLSELAREALTGSLRGGEIAETPSFYGFEPFPHRGPAISNAVIDQLREDEPE